MGIYCSLLLLFTNQDRTFEIALVREAQDGRQIAGTISQRISLENGEIHDRLDSLSSDSTSLLTCSRSTESRLKDVWTETSAISSEIRAMKSLLFDVLSSHSSSIDVADNTDITANTDDDRRAKRFPEHESSSRAKVYMRKTLSKRTHSSESALSLNSSHEPEFSTLLRTTKTFIDTLQAMWHPMVAEYISTVNALRTSQLLEKTMRTDQGEFMNTNGQPGATTIFADEEIQSLFGAKAARKSKKAMKQLATLKKICAREGLFTSLLKVDNECGIDEREFLVPS